MTADDHPKHGGAEPNSSAESAPPRGAPQGASGSELAGAGFQFAAAVLLCLFGGRWLDGRLGTSPWLLIVGTFAGAAVGFFAMYRTLTGAQARARRTQPPPRSAGRTGE